RSRDAGATWQDASRIAYPKGARYIEQMIPDPKAMEDAGKPITYKAAALMKVWVIGFAGKDQPGVIHAGTLPGGLFTTRDGGESWASSSKGMLNDYLPNPETEWGHDPHFVTLCPSAPDRLWQQNHCGVFTSDDGARRWTRVSKPDVSVHFGFPIAADEKDA